MICCNRWVLVTDPHLISDAYLAEAGLEQRVRHVALRHLERAKKVAALVGAPENTRKISWMARNERDSETKRAQYSAPYTESQILRTVNSKCTMKEPQIFSGL